MDCRRHSSDRTLPIGFCFSFPCQHTGIAEGTMLKLTKKFQNEGLVGQDPVKGFQRALDRQGANVRVAALVTASCYRYPKRHILLQGT